MEGYIMVKCGGLDLADTEEQTITGIYNSIKAAINTGKPIIYEGCTYDGDDCTAFGAMTVDEGEDGISFYVSTLKVVVASDDGVTVSDLIPEPEAPDAAG